MNKVSKLMKVCLVSALFVFVFTFGIALLNVDEAEAGWYFSRISLKKCDVKLVVDSFKWTGKEIRPMVTVMHEGKKLIIDKDYKLEYDNNIDAGLDTAEIKVKGIGEYRSSVKLSFDIIGIDIARECRFEYRNNKVIVFYGGEELDKRDYKTYKGDTERILVSSKPGNNPGEYYCTYEIYQDIVVNGKGQFYGEYIYRTIKVETVLENRSDEPSPAPGPGHGGGHGPGPAPGPGHGGGHDPGPAPGPGHGGGHGPGPAPGPGHGGGHGPSPSPGPGHGSR